MRSTIRDTLAGIAGNVQRLVDDNEVQDAIAAAASLLTARLGDGGRIYSAGNGGSLCDAMHFAEELSGSFRDEREPLPATAIADAAHLTCVGNDFGFDEVFARYVHAHLGPADVLVAISTSGTSRNVIRAAEAARTRGGSVIALTGRPGGPLGALADIEICTPAGTYSDRVQELHIMVIHLLVELVERTLFPANYPA